ncbi:MAG TPA: hypothetical protein VI072_21445 [Polyangiaceae bacterium]
MFVLTELSWVRKALAVAGALGVHAATASTLLGCGGAEDVSIGEESGALNMTRCFGSGTRCSASPGTEDVAPSSFTACTELAPGTLHEEFRRDLHADLCTGLECGLTLERLSVAPDGSAWVLGRLQRGYDDVTLVVSHFSVDGERIGHAEVVSTRIPSTSLDAELSVDDRGHAYVMRYSNYVPNADSDFEEAVWLHEYDSSAQPASAPVAFRGAAWTYVQAGSNGTVAVAGNAEDNAEQGFIAILDRAGSLRWNQTNVPIVGAARGRGVMGLSLLADDRTTLLADRQRWDDGSITLGLSRFGPDGNPVWDRSLTSGYEPAYPAALGSDSAGNVTTWALLSRTLHAVSSRTALSQLESFDSEGQLRWAMRFETHNWQSGAFAVEPASGRIFVQTDRILEITSDGGRCRAYEVGSTFTTAIALGKRADLYTLTGGTLTRYLGVSPE